MGVVLSSVPVVEDINAKSKEDEKIEILRAQQAVSKSFISSLLSTVRREQLMHTYDICQGKMLLDFIDLVML